MRLNVVLIVSARVRTVNVFASEQTYEEPLHQVILTDDAAANLAHDLLHHLCVSGCYGLCVHALLLS